MVALEHRHIRVVVGEAHDAHGIWAAVHHIAQQVDAIILIWLDEGESLLKSRAMTVDVGKHVGRHEVSPANGSGQREGRRWQPL